MDEKHLNLCVFERNLTNVKKAQPQGGKATLICGLIWACVAVKGMVFRQFRLV